MLRTDRAADGFAQVSETGVLPGKTNDGFAQALRHV